MTSRGLSLIVMLVIGVVVGLAVATFTGIESLWRADDAATDELQTDQQQPETPEWSDYEGQIQRPLFDLATAEDAGSYAAAQDLQARRMTRVVIQLADDADGLPSGYTIVRETEGSTGIQAWVPIDELLELAKASAVAYVRAPQEPTLD